MYIGSTHAIDEIVQSAGLGKYVNHYHGIAERPNVVVFDVWDSLNVGTSEGWIVKFFALRTIQSGEQLLLDYGEDYDNYDWQAVCDARLVTYRSAILKTGMFIKAQCIFPGGLHGFGFVVNGRPTRYLD